jgi:signal transduction histidine kinase
MNPDELRQLLIIFVSNSLEALEGQASGVVRVITGSRFFSAEQLAHTKLGSACLEGEYAFLEVHDNGPGIAPEILPKIFDPFFRADPARSRDAGGAGLGLAVARAIVERHGGRITCRSEPNRGTTMHIRLPVRLA